MKDIDRRSALAFGFRRHIGGRHDGNCYGSTLFTE